MASVTLADAKAHLSALVEQAERGEPVVITRRGKPVAQITGVKRTRKPIDGAALGELTKSMPRQKLSAGAWLRQVRDKERY
jgi:prevent-host-death family protein